MLPLRPLCYLYVVHYRKRHPDIYLDTVIPEGSKGNEVRREKVVNGESRD